MGRPKTLKENSLTVEERQNLVLDNLNIAERIARKLCVNPDMYEDCYQEAVLSMTKAAVYWNPEKAPYKAYAIHECYCAIKDLLYNDRALKVGVGENSNVYKFYKARTAKEQELERALTASEMDMIAVECGLSKAAYLTLFASYQSLDNTPFDDEETSVHECIADTKLESFDRNMEVNMFLETINDFMKTVYSSNADYVEIFCKHIRTLIDNELTAADKITLKKLVADKYPEFRILETDDKETADRKAKDSDNIYCAISNFCVKQKAEMHKYIKKMQMA